jgi:hypothetical protein
VMVVIIDYHLRWLSYWITTCDGSNLGLRPVMVVILDYDL